MATVNPYAPLTRKQFRKTASPAWLLTGLTIYLGGIYTNAGPAIGDTFAVGLYALLGAAIIILARPGYIQRGGEWLFPLLFFLLVWTVVGEQQHLGERFKSLAQMSAALIAMHYALHAVRETPRATLSSIFGYATLVIVIGTMTEVLIPAIKGLSDEARQWLYDGRFIYASDARDVALYGSVRPKFFTQEPSHVAKAFIAFGAAWYLLTEHRRKFWLGTAATLLMWYFLRSPMVLVAPVLVTALAFLGGNWQRRVSLVMLLIPVAVLGALLVAQVYSERIELIARREDFSFFGRFVGPYLVAIMALGDGGLDRMFFGVGLGGKESLEAYFMHVYQGYSSPAYLRSVFLTSLSNAAANSLSFFGYLGTPIFYALLAGYFRKALVSLAIVLLFFQLDGALEGVRMWGYIAIVVGAYLKVAESEERKRSHRTRPAYARAYPSHHSTQLRQ